MQKSILVVDDDATIRNTLSVSLTKRGYLVYTSQNGKECLDFIKKNTPNVVIIDCFMPVMDGLTTVKHLQNSEKKFPIIMISSDEIKSNCVFLRKPFKIESLLNILDKVLKVKIC